jgi:hypothetical protein
MELPPTDATGNSDRDRIGSASKAETPILRGGPALPVPAHQNVKKHRPSASAASEPGRKPNATPNRDPCRVQACPSISQLVKWSIGGGSGWVD